MYSVETQRLEAPTGMPVMVAGPTESGTYPCVVILHERYGLVKHTEDLAEKLAGSGYVVAAPDLFFEYPDQDALHRGDVGVSLPDRDILAKLDDAVAVFAGMAAADSSRLGMIGVCQSGRYSMVYGASRPLAGCVTIYGAAQEADWRVNDKQPDGMEGLIANQLGPVLGIFGEKDHVISLSDVRRFRNTLEKFGKSYDIVVYPDAPHGWLNDTMPGRYRPETAKMAWDKMLSFFEENLQNGTGESGVIFSRYQSLMHEDYDFTKNVRLE